VTPVGRWQSALYEGSVRHRRHGAVEHEFSTSVLMVLLDLDEVDDLTAAMPMWSSGGHTPVQFRRTDYFDGTDRPLGAGVAALVEERLGRRPEGRVRMLTQLRTWGWLFNPLTVYWCDDAAGDLDAIVLEVTNTPWHERHWYVVDARDPSPFDKELHVSPFLPMGLEYRLRTASPDEQIALQLEVGRGESPMFDADLRLERVELTPTHAISALVRHQWPTLKVSAMIRLQALRLWSKGAPYHRHPVPT
jgi:uncharacterized protein